MEAKELRIGNLVDFRGQTETVYQIINSGVCFFRGTTKKGVITQSYIWEAIKPIPLTEEWVLKFEQFGKTDKEGTPCFFNGDNIMLFDRGGCFDAYLHSEVNGDLFFAARLFYVHQLQNFYHAIEKEELTIKE
jgi:hypothetical protein